MWGLWSVLGLVFCALIVRTLTLLIPPRRRSEPDAVRRRRSLGTWWVLASLLTVAVLAGRIGVIVLFCIVSVLGFREFLSLMPIREVDRPVITMMYPVIVANYLLVYFRQEDLCAVFLPIFALLLVCTVCVIKAETRGFLQAISMLYLGVILTGYGVAHAAGLTMLPEALNPRGGAVGWVLFLILLTSVNDIAQAVWGRWIGKRRIAPKVSPLKSWEGLLAGVGTTTLIGLAVGPALIPIFNDPPPGLGLFSRMPYLGVGMGALLIGVGGFFGDLTMSAIKRDMGRKDSGTMLPGQGGLLDRIDSLTFTAPLFYWYVKVLSGA